MRRKTSSRRLFLRHGLFAGVAAAVLLAASSLRAQIRKLTKKEAGYIAREKPASQMCAQCIYFIDPDDCVLVQGPISPLGWCKYYGD